MGIFTNIWECYFSMTTTLVLLLYQCVYTDAILLYAGFTGDNTAKTPGSSNLFMEKAASPKLNAEKAKLFDSLVQGLMYMAQRPRTDLMLAASYLKTKVHEPNESDWSKFWRVLSYLNGTKDLGLTLGVQGEICADSSIDASHAVYKNGRSQGRMDISLGIGVV